MAMLAPALAATACSSDDTKEATTESAGTNSSSAQSDSSAESEITITHQWARNSPMVAGNGAAYLTVTSPEDDAIIGASVDAGIAEKVELHETKAMPAGGASSMPSAETSESSANSSMPSGDAPMEMQMVQVQEIELPAGTKVELKPGGLHIMLIDLPNDLEVGTSIELTLDFENAEDKVVTVPVLTEAPSS